MLLMELTSGSINEAISALYLRADLNHSQVKADPGSSQQDHHMRNLRVGDMNLHPRTPDYAVPQVDCCPAGLRARWKND